MWFPIGASALTPFVTPLMASQYITLYPTSTCQCHKKPRTMTFHCRRREMTTSDDVLYMGATQSTNAFRFNSNKCIQVHPYPKDLTKKVVSPLAPSA